MSRSLKDSTLFEEKFHYKEKRSNTVFYLVIMLVLLAIVGFRAYWTSNFGGVTVAGRSMMDTFQSGEKLLMRYVDGEEAERGDVIVVHVEHYPAFQKINAGLKDSEKTKYLIKRLIAVEGDHVKCEQGVISIQYGGVGDWEVYPDEYAYYTDKQNYNFDEYVVGEGEIFFLGDNRNDSMDSRYAQPGGSRLDCLYKASDITGVVPDWAIEHKDVLEKLLFWNN